MDSSNTKDPTPSIPPEKNSVLISEVKKFTSLYDTSDPNYYVLAERNKAWLQVAENCNEPAELCHLRWKSLRKRFAKEKKRFHEILLGQRRPWALFPKMSFLTPTASTRRIKPSTLRKKVRAAQRSVGLKTTSKTSTSDHNQNSRDDDMLILNDNDEVVITCKSNQMSEEDEYIYETLDDPDSALEIIKDKPPPKVKPTAIRSGKSPNPVGPSQTRGSGRIRKVTPKMQNSFIAKKLKQAQQVLQVPNVTTNKVQKEPPSLQKGTTISDKKTTQDKSGVLYQDNTVRHVATVNPNVVRIEKLADKETSPQHIHDNSTIHNNRTPEKTGALQRPFKVIKLTGKNPIIFSPEQLPNIQSFLKAGASSKLESNEMKTPLIKIKSVDNLNKQSEISPCVMDNGGESGNLDIIHSVGLVRKNAVDKCTETGQSSLLRDSLMEPPCKKVSHQSYYRSYSWNRPGIKTANKQTTTEKIQPDSQTNDFEIEETWNDIKQENGEEDTSWNQAPSIEHVRQNEEMVNNNPESPNKNIWNKLNESKLELVAYQRKLLEEQHKKMLEYMRKEHELKMTLLKAEIDLKRKQINIML